MLLENDGFSILFCVMRLMKTKNWMAFCGTNQQQYEAACPSFNERMSMADCWRDAHYSCLIILLHLNIIEKSNTRS